MTKKDAVYLITAIRNSGAKLTPWEIEFIADMEKKEIFSYVMDKKLMEIYSKVFGGGKYERREYIGGRK